MTKAEELKILEAIEGLIAESGQHSYISMTFAGICDVCRHNIEDDFGAVPVHDMEVFLNDFQEEVHAHDVTKRQLAESQKMCKEALDLNEKLRKTADEWEKNAHDAGEMYCELEKECAQKDAEIIRLKAEIVRMRLHNMTDADWAELFEVTKGVK